MGSDSRSALVLCVALGLAACAGEHSSGSGPAGTGAPPAGPATTAAAPEPGSQPAQAPEAAVLDAVDAYWAAIVAAGDVGDPDHPELRRHLGGEALRHSREVFAERRGEGLVTRNPTGVEVVSPLLAVEGDSAWVRHCFVADEQLEDELTGETVAVEDAAVDVMLRLAHEDDAWKVVGNEVLSVREAETC